MEESLNVMMTLGALEFSLFFRPGKKKKEREKGLIYKLETQQFTVANTCALSTQTHSCLVI